MPFKTQLFDVPVRRFCSTPFSYAFGWVCNLRGGLPIQLPKSTPGVPMRFAVLLLIAFLAAPLLSAQRVVPAGGQWLIEPGERSAIIRLTIRYGERRSWDNWNSQNDVPSSQLVGLSAADMRGSGVTVHFKIVRSAGTLDCEGWFDDGKGSGHFTYQPNPDFVAELAKRGVTGPPPDGLGAVPDDGGGRGTGARGRAGAAEV